MKVVKYYVKGWQRNLWREEMEGGDSEVAGGGGGDWR